MLEQPEEHSRIIVTRLLRYYDPFAVLGLSRSKTAQRVVLTRPRAYVEEYHREASYHVGRIRWLMLHVAAWRDSPISVDNFCDRGHFGPPIVVDGHHRLCAAALLRRRHILASYSGLVSTLDYLMGARRKAPVF